MARYLHTLEMTNDFFLNSLSLLLLLLLSAIKVMTRRQTAMASSKGLHKQAFTDLLIRALQQCSNFNISI